MTIFDCQIGSTTGGQIAQLIGSTEHLKLDIQGHVFESRSGPLWYLPSLDILCCANPSSWQDNSILSGVTVFEGEDHLSGEEVTEVTGTR